MMWIANLSRREYFQSSAAGTVLLAGAWAEAGAISQCSTDVYIANGVTNAWRTIEYARAHPSLVINLHWAWMPHAHLAMACDDKQNPLVEFPMGEDFPKSILDGPNLLAPDWPGVYRWEGR